MRDRIEERRVEGMRGGKRDDMRGKGRGFEERRGGIEERREG